MKAIRIVAGPGATHEIGKLALPVTERSGIADAGGYHRLARGERPVVAPAASPATSLSTLLLSPGHSLGVASQPGALLSFVVSGHLTLTIGRQSCVFEPGDLFLLDETSAAAGILDAEGTGRLVQLGVIPDWPGSDAAPPHGPSKLSRLGNAPKLKRISTGREGKAFYGDFLELFAGEANRWSTLRPIAGFRILRWEDGFMDWHPSVVNQLALVSSGEMEFEVGGGAKETFRAGDACLAEDRTGEGHTGRARGVAYVSILTIDTEHLW